MLKRLIRIGITALGAALGYGVFRLLRYIGNQTKWIEEQGITRLQLDIAAVALALFFAFVFFMLTPRLRRTSSKLAKNVEKEIKHISGSELITGTAGLVVGLLIAFLVSQAFVGIENMYLNVGLSLLVYIVFGWIGVVVLSRRGQDIINSIVTAARKGGEKQKKPKSMDSSPKILDTSVIIDGRIADIMRTGFLEGRIVIPEFVLIELQHIADSSDSLKRNRGRRGLDILKRIQTDYGIEIYNTLGEKTLADIPEVDVKLLKLAQIMNGKVVTNDFNLNKVAQIKGVEVLNINELANMLRAVVLPGEEMQLFLVKEGKEHGQALAYLDDGTMIVVEEGRKHIGQTITVIVSSVLQTAAGRMIFAKPK
ncbi:MAG: PIN domain-containing protein [Clostridiales Family XIII bacterium]|jgi:uncharacterized protein YacL|nr:PIN domain-containing protein [Clostridiales Family XIII bacterium]